MTIKQLIVGTVVGVSAIGLMLHRLPKTPATASTSDSKSHSSVAK